MPSILFVCTANQIRSPIAQEYFKFVLKKKQMPGNWLVDSAGTWAYPGAPATPLAILVGHENELSLENHRSKPITSQLLMDFDLILVMEHRHKEALSVEFPEFINKIYLLSSVEGNNRDIQDPVSGGVDSHRIAAREIISAIEIGFEKIINLSEVSGG